MSGDLPSAETRVEREALFATLVSAYMRRDFGVFEAAVRPDMILTFPGSSHIAGIYHGYEAFGRYLLATRDLIRPLGTRIGYAHEPDQMVVTQDIVVSGRTCEATTVLRIRIRFDQDGRVVSFLVDLEDQRLFDEIIDSSLADAEAT